MKSWVGCKEPNSECLQMPLILGSVFSPSINRRHSGSSIYASRGEMHHQFTYTESTFVQLVFQPRIITPLYSSNLKCGNCIPD